MDNGENFSPNFYSLFRPSREKTSIIPSLLIDGEQIQDPKIIKNHVRSHFQCLLRPSPSQDSFSPKPDNELKSFFDSVFQSSPVLTPQCKDPLTLTQFEARKAFNKLKSRSAPGPDGVTPRLAKFLFSLLPNLLTTSLQKELDPSPPLSPSTKLKRRKIILIRKKDSHTKPGMKAYRPISLLTAFYKVASHILSTRVSGFAISNNLIPQNSLAYQKAKSASEGVRFILDTISSKNGASEDLLIIQNNFSSAYDKADKGFLINLLHYFKFPFALVEAIGLLLSTPKVDILLNNKIILSIEALASLAQGCPLSPPLFSIITIPLIALLQANGPQITLKLPQLEDRLPIPNNIFFADDSLTLLNSLSDLHSVIQCFDIFSSFSNLAIEVNKSTLASSKVIDLHNLPQDQLDIIPLSGINHSLKFLGINIILDPEQGSSTDANLQTLLAKTKAFCSSYNKLYLNQTGLENVAKTYLSSTVHFYTQNFFPTNSQVSENQKEINKFVLRKKYTNANQRHLPSHKGGVGLPSIPAIFLAAKSFFVKKSLTPRRSISTVIPDYILSKLGLTWNLVYSAGVGELRILGQLFTNNFSPFWSNFCQSLIDIRKALWFLDNPHHPLGKNPNSYVSDNLSSHYLKLIRTSILKDLSPPNISIPPLSVFFKNLHPLFSSHYLTSHFSNPDFSPKSVTQIQGEALLLGNPATLPISDAQVTSMLSNACKHNLWPTSNSSAPLEHYFSPNTFSNMVRDNQLSRLFSRIYLATVSQRGLKDMTSHQKWEKVLLATTIKDDIAKACRAHSVHRVTTTGSDSVKRVCPTAAWLADPMVKKSTTNRSTWFS